MPDNTGYSFDRSAVMNKARQQVRLKFPDLAENSQGFARAMWKRYRRLCNASN